MPGSLLDLVTNFQANPLPHGAQEQEAKNAIIVPVLDRIGWDPSNHQEFKSEYRVGPPQEQGKVDYCLLLSGTETVFIEAKKPREDLRTHERQLQKYTSEVGVDLAVLTNGLLWWLYLPGANGTWEQRRFCAIDMRQQDAAAIVEHFTTFLSRSAIASGAARRAATEVLDGAKHAKAIQEALPIAWAQLLREPDGLLFDLLADAVYAQCKLRPDTETIAAFLAREGSPTPLPAVYPSTSATEPAQPRQPAPVSTGSTGKRQRGSISRPSAFSIFGQQPDVTSWREVTIAVAKAVYDRHADSFERVRSLSYFTRDPQSWRDTRNPRPVANSGWFVAVNLSGEQTVKQCQELLVFFGYPNPDSVFSVEAIYPADAP